MPILRVVHIRLPNREGVQSIIDQAESTFWDIPGVMGIEAYPSAEEPGVLLLVTLTSMEAIPIYRDDPIHRAFADDLVKPLGGQVEVSNYERE